MSERDVGFWVSLRFGTDSSESPDGRRGRRVGAHSLFRVLEQSVDRIGAFEYRRCSLALPFVRLRHLPCFGVDDDRLLESSIVRARSWDRSFV